MFKNFANFPRARHFFAKNSGPAIPVASLHIGAVLAAAIGLKVFKNFANFPRARHFFAKNSGPAIPVASLHIGAVLAAAIG